MTAPKFTIGCDPEVFVQGPDGKVVSAHTFMPGSKKEPHKVNFGGVQPDGLAAEFNTDPVGIEDSSGFNARILTVLDQVQKFLPADHKILIEPSVQFDKEYYDSLPENVKELGCDPDFCAYSEDIFAPNPRPDGDSGLRSAAGHIHIGWGSDIPVDNPDHMNICRNFIRQMDAYVGLYMTCIDTDDRRRTLYGKAGAFRPKSYGVEYRTPSNVWIKNSNYRQDIIWLVRNAISNMRQSRPWYLYFETNVKAGITGFNVQEIINTGNRDAAGMLLMSYMGLTVPGFDSVTGKFKKGY